MNNLKGQTKRPNKTKNENAITLVALIITIIILIILAAVTINSLTHDGLADLAIKSTQDYQKAQSDEMNMLNEIDSMVKETIKNIEDGTTKPKPDEPSNPWDKDDLDEVKVKDENGNDVSIPKPEDSTILNPDATVDEGIVMKDSKDNEWVWVPVDAGAYNSMFAESETPIALSGDTGVTTTRYSTSATLVGHVANTKPGTNSGSHEPDIVKDYDPSNYRIAGFSSLKEMAENLVSDYEKMIDSIEKYRGFYIGRYELSSNGVKASKSPTTNANWYNLYKQCKELTIDENKGMTRMIWGCQWDVTCLWIKNSGYNINDSSSYGNYTRNKKNTGSSETYKTNNIYDMAGNIWEYTQETRNSDARYSRGHDSNASVYSIIYRDQYYRELNSQNYDYLRHSTSLHHKPIRTSMEHLRCLRHHYVRLQPKCD